MAFLVQGDKKNEWWLPTPNQKKAISPIYKKWLSTQIFPTNWQVTNCTF